MASETPATVMSVAATRLAFRISLEFISRSAPIELGVDPSRESVLSNDVWTLSKLVFSSVLDA